MTPSKRIIFHIDMDAFFTSVEQRDNPRYKGKPVIVGAQPGKRGVVSAASYEARKFGIHSAMPINEAFNRCPLGIFITPRMAVYSEASQKIMEIFSQFSPDIEQISVDEAFIDMTGTEKLFGTPFEAAKKISDKIKTEQHLTASIGIAPNKFLAKIASDIHKPDGITIVPSDPNEIIQWLAPMNVQKIWGVGKKSASILMSVGVTHICDLQALSLDYLIQRFGKHGAALFYLCRGIDERPVAEDNDIKSISREHTFNVDSRSKEEWAHALFLLCQDVAKRARQHGVKGSTVVLSWRRPDFSRHSRRMPLQSPTCTAKPIYEQVLILLDQLREPALRLIGVGITGLDCGFQTDLFANKNGEETWEKSEHIIDNIKTRFGEDSISKGLEIGLKRKHTPRDKT
jgi:nucleotidyltransferase/DNA polymerase involved in DNA repair